MKKRLPIWAYGSTPKEAGTFTLYRALRSRLLAQGYDLRCVGVGTQQATLWDQRFADEGCFLLGEELPDLKAQAQCFVQWCQDEHVQFVMPVNSPALRAALPHLPTEIRLIARCADSVDFGYQRTLTCRERIASVVATTPRHVEDLTSRYQVPAELITLIPHGVSAQPFDATSRSPADRRPGQPLRLAFLGRLEHRQKGILFVPSILRRLHEKGIKVTLSVAGQGEHEAQFFDKLNAEGMGSQVRPVGVLKPCEVAPFLSAHDALLFPSQHEGFGFVLIEALMAGCVPIASLLPGVTDFIVRPGQTGLLCPVGDTEAFAQAVAELASDPARLAKLAKGAREDARARFTDERLTTSYVQLLNRWQERPAPAFEPLPWSAFRAPADLRVRPVHNWIRALKRQIGVRV